MKKVLFILGLGLLASCGTKTKNESKIQSVSTPIPTPPPVSSYIDFPIPTPCPDKKFDGNTSIEWSCESRCKWYQPDCLAYVGYCGTFRKMGGEIANKVGYMIAEEPHVKKTAVQEGWTTTNCMAVGGPVITTLVALKGGVVCAAVGAGAGTPICMAVVASLGTAITSATCISLCQSKTLADCK